MHHSIGTLALDPAYLVTTVTAHADRNRVTTESLRPLLDALEEWPRPRGVDLRAAEWDFWSFLHELVAVTESEGRSGTDGVRLELARRAIREFTDASAKLSDRADDTDAVLDAWLMKHMQTTLEKEQPFASPYLSKALGILRAAMRVNENRAAVRRLLRAALSLDPHGAGTDDADGASRINLDDGVARIVSGPLRGCAVPIVGN